MTTPQLVGDDSERKSLVESGGVNKHWTPTNEIWLWYLNILYVSPVHSLLHVQLYYEVPRQRLRPQHRRAWRWRIRWRVCGKSSQHICSLCVLIILFLLFCGTSPSSHLCVCFLSPAALQLEDLEVTVADHIQKVLKPNFGAAWEEVGDEFEKEETFALASVRTLDGAYKSSLVTLIVHQPSFFTFCILVQVTATRDLTQYVSD